MIFVSSTNGNQLRAANQCQLQVKLNCCLKTATAEISKHTSKAAVNGVNLEHQVFWSWHSLLPHVYSDSQQKYFHHKQGQLNAATSVKAYAVSVVCTSLS